MRRLVSLGAAAGLASLSLGQLNDRAGLSVMAQGTSGSALIISDANDGGTGTTQLTSSPGAISVPPEAATLRLQNDLSVTDISSPTPIGLAAYTPATEGFANETEINGGIGVWSQTGSAAGAALYGLASATSGSNFGAIGYSQSTGGVGVRGVAGAATGSTIGVDGRSESTDGVGVRGLAKGTSGVGVKAVAGVPTAKPMIAQAASGQSANIQEWQNSSGNPLAIVSPVGWLGVGTGTSGASAPLAVVSLSSGASQFEEIQFRKSGGTQPSRLHATGDGINRFSVNQNYDGANFNLDDTSKNGVSFLINSNPAASGIFAVQYIPAGPNPATGRMAIDYLFMKANGKIGIGTNSPTERLHVVGKIRTTGGVVTGDITFANDYKLTEDEQSGLLLLNQKGERIARFDENGNLHIKGRVIEET